MFSLSLSEERERERDVLRCHATSLHFRSTLGCFSAQARCIPTLHSPLGAQYAMDVTVEGDTIPLCADEVHRSELLRSVQVSSSAAACPLGLSKSTLSIWRELQLNQLSLPDLVRLWEVWFLWELRRSA